MARAAKSRQAAGMFQRKEEGPTTAGRAPTSEGATSKKAAIGRGVGYDDAMAKLAPEGREPKAKKKSDAPAPIEPAGGGFDQAAFNVAFSDKAIAAANALRQASTELGQFAGDPRLMGLLVPMDDLLKDAAHWHGRGLMWRAYGEGLRAGKEVDPIYRVGPDESDTYFELSERWRQRIAMVEAVIATLRGSDPEWAAMLDGVVLRLQAKVGPVLDELMPDKLRPLLRPEPEPTPTDDAPKKPAKDKRRRAS